MGRIVRLHEREHAGVVVLTVAEQELTYENLLQAVKCLEGYRPKEYSIWRDLALPEECAQALQAGYAKEFERLVRKSKGR